jgi:CDP-2,3-bis-(O-geranylgeranyl)-sn-glycerol synthase
MQPILIAKLLILLMLANGTPLVAKKVLGGRFAWPLDGGASFIDGRPLLGPSKTMRGVLLALIACTAGAPILGLGWPIGLGVGAGAMAGDLLSSFIKRRLGRASSSRALGLDQVPESLIPLIACAGPLGLGTVDILVAVAIFLPGELLLSRWLYRLRLRDQPY